ncbi:MAG: hypothetical protein WAL32_12880 [Terriglobales bacterium]
MKRTLRMLGMGALLVVAVGLLAVATYDKYLAMLLWPGARVINYVYSALGFDGIGFAHFGWMFWPALLINVLFYESLYLLFHQAWGWKRKKVWIRQKV